MATLYLMAPPPNEWIQIHWALPLAEYQKALQQFYTDNPGYCVRLTNVGMPLIDKSTRRRGNDVQ